MTSPYLLQPLRPLAAVVRGPPTIKCWANVWLDGDGNPCVQTVFTEESEVLNEITEHTEGYVWRGHTYAGTIRIDKAVLVDRESDAIGYEREQRAERRCAPSAKSWS